MKKVLLIPVLVDIEQDKVLFHSDNIFYKKWNAETKKHFLLEYILPSEDLEDISIFSKNMSSIEDYDFEEVIN